MVENLFLEVDISLEESLIKDSISESDSTSKESTSPYPFLTFSWPRPEGGKERKVETGLLQLFSFISFLGYLRLRIGGSPRSGYTVRP